MVGGRPRAPEPEDGPNSGASASRIVHRKLRELMSADGTRDAARARSMALDLLEHATFVGTLRSFNRAAGGGLVDCPEARALFSRDLPVPEPECAGVPTGERISFRVRLVRGQPSVHGVAWPPDEGGDVVGAAPAASRPGTAAPQPPPSGVAAALAQADDEQAPAWSEAAASWREARERDPRAGMDSLLAHAEGPGRSARDWRPSVEANDRGLMAATLAHKCNPGTYPAPQVRQGTFVGWKSN